VGYEQASPAQEQGEGGQQAGVAMLAQRLARSAIGVLEASELESARDVDFLQMDVGSKAEVSERFADAIETVAQAVREEPDFAKFVEPQRPRPAVQERPVAGLAPEAPPAPGLDVPWEALAEAVEKADAPREADMPAKVEAVEAKVEAVTEPTLEECLAELVQEPEPASAPAAPMPQKQESTVPSLPAAQAPTPAPAPAPVLAPAQAAAQPLAQAQFMGAAQPPAHVPHGGPLETAVRDMLRPLLVQWLNENMPRILENAIREEISVRGLLPKSDG
jgi:cell pole-organizing protein PopZ